MDLENLSDTAFDQALMLISQVPTFDGTPDELCSFVKGIDSILKLYPTQDERQNSILYLAINFRLSGEASGLNVMGEAKTWIELKTALIKAFNNHTSYGELLRQLHNTRFNGSLREFVEELEYKAFIIRNKLGLDDEASTACYVHSLKDTIINVINRKLPDRIFMPLSRHDISTISNLKKAAQIRGLYEINTGSMDKCKDLNNNYSSDSFQHVVLKGNNNSTSPNLYEKQNSDLSLKASDSSRLILRAHRNLKQAYNCSK